MRKNITVLTAGVVATMLIAAGCAGQSDNNHTSTQETSAQTETPAQTTVSPETESSKNQEEDTKAQEEESREEASDSGSGEISEKLTIPVKIWGEITEVGDGVIHVDNQSENSSKGEIILTIDPENTLILDGENGFPVELEKIETGTFEAYIGPAMTMSLPPQTTPVMVIVNIPEDTPAAQYVIAAESVEDKDGGKTLTAKDGTEYALSQEVSVIPFLTKQYVTLEDIAEESRLLVWLGDDDTVERIVLFNP